MLRKVLINKVWLYSIFLLLTSPLANYIGCGYLMTGWENSSIFWLFGLYFLAEFLLILTMFKVYRYQCFLLTKKFYLKDYIYKIYLYLCHKFVFIFISIVLIFINKFAVAAVVQILIFSAISNSLVNVLDSGMVSPRDGLYVSGLRYSLISTITALFVVLVTFIIFKFLI